MLACDEEQAQYIQCLDALYRADWMAPVTTDFIIFQTVTLIRIEKEEYDILYKAMESGEEVTEPEEPPEPDTPPVDENEQVTVEYMA